MDGFLGKHLDLSGAPWAVAASDLACHNLEKVLGSHSISTCDQEDAQDMDDTVPDKPNIWTDGSREPIPHLDVEVAGAGALHTLPQP